LTGDKRYELSNHLGNVLVVINDKKIPEFEKPDMPETGLVAFNAEVLSYSDYYPFGMLQDARQGSKANYRYGFNGMEKDDELKGEGNSYDFGARMYNPRVGRWFKMDPLFMKYAYDSPFLFSGNSPISITDPDGKRKRKITIVADENGNVTRTTAKLIDYSLKSKVRYETDPLSGDAVKVYDYYDTVDMEYIVKDKNNKILSRKITRNASERLSHNGVSPITPEAWLKLNDKIDDIAQETYDPLKGNEKGHFKGGITLVLDDSGNVLNVRGLERINSAKNTTQIDITEIYVIASGQVGAPSISQLDNINKFADGVKVMEQAESTIKSAVKQIDIYNSKRKSSNDTKKESDSITRSYYDENDGGKFIKSVRVAKKDLKKDK